MLMIVRTILLASCAVGASICGRGPAWSQPVSFDDLQGSVINASLIEGRVQKRDGRTFEVRVEQNVNITIGPGQELYFINNITAHTPLGVRKSPPSAGSFTVDLPREVKSR